HLVILSFSGLLDGKGVFGVEFLYLLVGLIVLFVCSVFEGLKPSVESRFCNRGKARLILRRFYGVGI
ncbi:MAG: hypothetical protein NC252_09480, partial [Roseburia sp.]|nr:hypothetical protein [Roseburia sp.]